MCIAALCGRKTKWNLAHRQNVSFRTSPQTGVGIPIEFQAVHRHTDCHFCAVFRNSSTKSSANQGIATPVCALARNDRKFDTAPVGATNSNLPVYLQKPITETGMIHPPAAEASRFAAVFFFFLLTVFLPSRIISMCLDSKEMLRRSGNDTAGTAGIAAH